MCPSNQKNNDLYVNNDDENISSDDVEFVEENQLGKPGRKNIRKVLDDVNLGEDTKKANKEEEAQRQRLLKKKKEVCTCILAPPNDLWFTIIIANNIFKKCHEIVLPSHITVFLLKQL